VRVFAPGRPDWHYAVAIAAVAACFILAADATREYLSYGTESDFVWRFAPEARRFLQGEPLISDFHPPFYSMVVGVGYLITGDWLRAGLLVSWMSGIAALLSSFLLFTDLCGSTAGFGALLGLLGSGVFMLNWGLATSDVFFLAGFILSCLFAVRALRNNSIRFWIGCGVVVGLCIATRANGIALALLAIAPFFGAASRRVKLQAVGAFLGGMALPLGALALYAAATGSNVIPRGTYLNLAVTYFSGGQHDTEAGRQAARRFTGLSGVLLHDPAALAQHYVLDLYRFLTVGLTRLIELPLYYALLPGLILLIGMHLSPALLIIALVALSQILLVNLAYFQPRLYLFLVPWVGAGIAEVFRRLAETPWPRLRSAILATLALMWLFAVGQAVAKTGYVLWHAEDELSELIPLARRTIAPGAVVFASKPNLAFYTGARHRFLPELPGVTELREYAVPGSKAEVYIFYGDSERERHPQYATLADAPPSWLQVVARSARRGNWVLLRAR
jgi:4-amino-4-deoxy-L-arabinose transferase-like glycosyltransferase